MENSIWQRVSDPKLRAQQIMALKEAVAKGEEPDLKPEELSGELLELLFDSALFGLFKTDIRWITQTPIDS